MKSSSNPQSRSAYGLLIKAASLLQSPLLLAVRLYWGWQFLTTGWGKLHSLGKVTGFFSSLGIPLPHANAIFISLLEFIGGALLMVGLGSRFFALLLSVDMAVAYIVADRDALRAIFSDPGKFYAADPFTFLFASLLILIFGAGIFSLDYALSKRS